MKEDLILTWRPKREVELGKTQHRFLSAVEEDLLSDKARRKKQEWSHKYSGENQPPQETNYDWEGIPSPIDEPALAKMSDENWRGALRKYDDSGYSRPYLQKDISKGGGGVNELAKSLTEQVKNDPARFYHLTEDFDEKISLKYIMACSQGWLQQRRRIGSLN